MTAKSRSPSKGGLSLHLSGPVEIGDLHTFERIVGTQQLEAIYMLLEPRFLEIYCKKIYLTLLYKSQKNLILYNFGNFFG